MVENSKNNLENNIDPDWENLKRDSKTNYIICPDMSCQGFDKKPLQCKISLRGGIEYGFESCPKRDLAYKILHCSEGHPNKLEIDGCTFRRMNCSHEYCMSISFEQMNDIYVRIPLDLVEEFLKKPFVKKE